MRQSKCAFKNIINIYIVDTHVSNSSWASTLHNRLSKMFKLSKILKNKRERRQGVTTYNWMLDKVIINIYKTNISLLNIFHNWLIDSLFPPYTRRLHK
jgi:hypothetical protein